ncbi:hypothetical protein TWF694_007043 [Orbilia ellipsospora]|uniref:Uncharacterized protein n=1 Tax=Orbilia ellipsospora TaxID=2528407 RepID=A0AAV9XTP7_9PEZI
MSSHSGTDFSSKLRANTFRLLPTGTLFLALLLDNSQPRKSDNKALNNKNNNQRHQDTDNTRKCAAEPVVCLTSQRSDSIIIIITINLASAILDPTNATPLICGSNREIHHLVKKASPSHLDLHLSK